MKPSDRHFGRKLIESDEQEVSVTRRPRLQVLHFVWEIPGDKPQEVKRIWP